MGSQIKNLVMLLKKGGDKCDTNTTISNFIKTCVVFSFFQLSVHCLTVNNSMVEINGTVVAPIAVITD